MGIELRPAAGLDMATLADVFTSGFEGYLMPVRMTDSMAASHIHNFDIDLEASFVAVDGGQYVGIVLTAIRDRLSWIGGLGVNVSHRRQGIGRLMMNAVIDDSWRRGLDQVTLEVIEANEPARAMYRSLGFRELRPLLIIERAPAPLPEVDGAARRVPAAEALAAYDRLHRLANPWQRARPSLLNQADHLEGWVVRRDGDISAYVIAAVRESGIAFYDVAGEPAALANAVVSLHRQHPEATGRLVNLRDDDPAWPTLQSLGYVAKFSQIEMALDRSSVASD